MYKLPLILFTILAFISCNNLMLGTELPPEKDPITNGGILPESNLPHYTAIYAPKQLTASLGLTDGIILTWQSEITAESYNIYKSETEDGSYTFIANILATHNNDINTTEEYLDTTILKSIPYYYKITSINNDSIESGFSKMVLGFAYSSMEGIQPPVNILLSNGDYEDQIVIQWNEVSNATKYRLFYSTTGFIDTTEGSDSFSQHWTEIGVDEIKNPSSDNLDQGILAMYTHTGLTDSTSHFYCIQTVKDNEYSRMSEVNQGFLKNPVLPVVTGLTATYDPTNPLIDTVQSPDSNATESEITISWDINKDYRYYALYRSDLKNYETEPLFQQIAIIDTNEMKNTALYIDTDDFAIDELDHKYNIRIIDVIEEDGIDKIVGYGPFENGGVWGSIIKEAPVLAIESLATYEFNNPDKPLIFDLTLYPDKEFIYPNVTANDNLDKNLTRAIVTTINQEYSSENPDFPLVELGDKFSIEYKVTDRAGYQSAIQTIYVEVTALINPFAPISFTHDSDFPTFILRNDDIDVITFDINQIEVFSGAPIENAEYIVTSTKGGTPWKIPSVIGSNKVEGTLSLTSLINHTSDSQYTGERLSIQLQVSNDYDTKIISSQYSLNVYADCPVVPNGNFQDGTTISPWIWDIQYHTRYDNALINGWHSYNNSSENYKDSSWNNNVEQILELAIQGSEKFARFCDTTENTKTLIPAGSDVEAVGGRIYSPSINISSLPPSGQYKLTASVYRGSNCSTDIKFTAKFPVDNIPSISVPSGKGQWHSIEFLFNPDTDGTLNLELFKGTDYQNSDHGEVSLDNVTLEYIRK